MTELARSVTLSANSISAIYQKLRAHYVRIGIFRNFYEDEEPDCPSSEAYEFALLEFHLARVARMRGIAPGRENATHHFCESCWRFQLVPFFEGRSANAVHKMAYAELLTYLKLGGPVGASSLDMAAIRHRRLRILDRRAAWLERSSQGFKGEEQRASLREIREL